MTSSLRRWAVAATFAALASGSFAPGTSAQSTLEAKDKAVWNSLLPSCGPEFEAAVAFPMSMLNYTREQAEASMVPPFLFASASAARLQEHIDNAAKAVAGADRFPSDGTRMIAADAVLDGCMSAARLKALVGRAPTSSSTSKPTLPAAPKARPSPPKISLVTNSGSACFTVTITDVELVDRDTQWRFQYNLKNTCSTPQLYIAEEKRAGEKPAQPGVFELAVLNGGTWYNWAHPGLAPGLAFQPSDPRGSSGPPVESQGVRTSAVFRNVTETAPIFIWLASCAAYSNDGFAMTLFKAAASLAEDPRIQCVRNIHP